MFKRWAIIIISLTMIIGTFIGCGNEEVDEGEGIVSEHKPPPVEYAVGKVDINDEANEPSVHLKIAVAPGTAEKDIKRLFAYFEKDRYAEYDIIWVDVYYDIESAKSADVSADFLVASLRVNRPNFREESYSVDEVTFEDEMPEVTLNTEEVIFLGYKGRMFDSPKQARALLDLMEEKTGPGDLQSNLGIPGEMRDKLQYRADDVGAHHRRGIARSLVGDDSRRYPGRQQGYGVRRKAAARRELFV